jgi:hypothetical protein
MLKKIALIFVLGFTLQLITGCVDCNCSKPEDILFTRNSMSLISLDASLPKPYYATNSVISGSKYGIQIRLNSTIQVSNSIRGSFGFIQTAYACSCAEPLFIPKEYVVAVEIFSDNDFNSFHPKNSDLSSYFQLKLPNDNIFTIADYLQYLKKFPQRNYSAFLEGLYLQYSPEKRSKHKFRVKVTLSDGRILEAETAEVELT